MLHMYAKHCFYVKTNVYTKDVARSDLMSQNLLSRIFHRTIVQPP